MSNYIRSKALFLGLLTALPLIVLAGTEVYVPQALAVRGEIPIRGEGHEMGVVNR